MKTYRDRINDNNTNIFDKYIVEEEFINELIDEIETKVSDIVDDIESYDIQSALEKLKELLKELY